MTPQEAARAFKAFCAEVGPNADLYISLNLEPCLPDGVLRLSISPDGLLKPERVAVYADDFAALLVEARSKWAEFKDEHRARRVRAMALEIIRITAEQGCCTDAALRSEKFTHAEVTELGADACADATEIASNGPFSITALEKANAA